MSVFVCLFSSRRALTSRAAACRRHAVCCSWALCSGHCRAADMLSPTSRCRAGQLSIDDALVVRSPSEDAAVTSSSKTTIHGDRRRRSCSTHTPTATVFAQPPTRGEPCGFVSGLELAIRYSIPYLEGSHDPDMMSEVVPRFEPFERCCMVILFVGGRGKTTPHPKSPPLLR